MHPRKVRYSCIVLCLSVLLGFSWSAQGADVPIKTKTPIQPAPSKTQPYMKSPVTPTPTPTPTPTTAVVKNPSWIKATAGIDGEVVLTWAPVPGVTAYCLYGSGNPGQPLPSPFGAPPYFTGTTYTVKNLPAGNHVWTVGSRPACEQTPTNPVAQTSINVGWYKYSFLGFDVLSQTNDTMTNADGWGDEVYLTIELIETAPNNQKRTKEGRLPSVGNFGDINNAANRVQAGDASDAPTNIVYSNPKNKGGLRTGNIHYGQPFPFRAPWCGQLVQNMDGSPQNIVVISSTVWEWDDTQGAPFADYVTWWRDHNKDLQNSTLMAAVAKADKNFANWMNFGAVLNEAGAKGVLQLLDITGKQGTRPIGIQTDGQFIPKNQILTYNLAERALKFQGINDTYVGGMDFYYKEPIGQLNGEYMIKGRLERANPGEICY